RSSDLWSDVDRLVHHHRGGGALKDVGCWILDVGLIVSAILFLSVFLIAACGLIYELVAGTLASYLLGDSVFQFSTVIGSYLFAMGVGSYLSRYIARGLVARFVSIELMVGLVGGFSSAALFLAFAYTQG